MMSPQSEVVEKRVHEDASPVEVNKKRKLVDAEIIVHETSNSKVDPSELASAFALASLASLSARQEQPNCDESRDANRDHADEGVRVSASWEARSPKADSAPVSPEQRSPIGNRRVHFAPSSSIKEKHVSAGMSMPQASQVSSPQSVMMSPRSLHHPPHGVGPPSPHSSHSLQSPYSPHSPLSPHPFQRRGAFVPRSPPHAYSMTAYGRPHQQPMHPHQLRQIHHPMVPPWARGPMYPPQRLMQPPLLHPENHWICDFCNVAAFATYEDACRHEETCKIRGTVKPLSREHHSIARMSRDGPIGSEVRLSQSSSCEEETQHVKASSSSSSSSSSSAEQWFAGSTSLSIDESDSEWLSELNCFVRKFCVEAFSATEEDVARTSKRGRIVKYQVGIRCRFCAHLNLKDKAVAAVSFPTSVSGIYESVKRWQRVHLEVCPEVPDDVQTKLSTLANTNVWVPTTRQYWTDSARALGLIDTNDGIRFSCNPVEMKVKAKIVSISRPDDDPDSVEETPSSQIEDSATKKEDSSPMAQDSQAGGYIVLPDDMEMIPPYVYYLMRQVEPCHFTEADRFVARSKGPVGYPGFQCRHCSGHAGLGKYFPVSAKSLSTNSTSQNIHAHLLKCRKCPEAIKDRLVQLKIEKSRSPRLEPGWRKVFFDKVWERLHGKNV